jgi:hypothetical protein
MWSAPDTADLWLETADGSRPSSDCSSTKSVNTSTWRRNSSAIIGGWLRRDDPDAAAAAPPQAANGNRRRENSTI